MGLRTLPLSPSQNCSFPPQVRVAQKYSSDHRLHKSSNFRILAKSENGKEEPKKSKQSLFSSVTEALDFSQVRSAKDAELLEEARENTSSGNRMTREQVLQTSCFDTRTNSVSFYSFYCSGLSHM